MPSKNTLASRQICLHLHEYLKATEPLAARERDAYLRTYPALGLAVNRVLLESDKD